MIHYNKENIAFIDEMFNSYSGMSLSWLSEMSVTGIEGHRLHNQLSIVAAFALLHTRLRLLHRGERDYVYSSSIRPFVRGVVLSGVFDSYHDAVRSIVHVDYKMIVHSFVMAVRRIQCSELPRVLLLDNPHDMSLGIPVSLIDSRHFGSSEDTRHLGSMMTLVTARLI